MTLGMDLLTPEEHVPGVPAEVSQVLKELLMLARLPAGLIWALQAGASFGQA